MRFSQEIRMKTADVLRMLEENRLNHVRVFALQKDAWKVAMEAYNVKMGAWAQESGAGTRPKEPVRPVNYAKEYERYLTIFRHHCEDIITLDEETVRVVLFDEFQWSGDFNETSRLYAVSSN